MNDPLRLPCPTCSGTRTTTSGDRHAETVMDVCCTCHDTGTIPARPGETQEASFRPAAPEPAVPYYAKGGSVRKASIHTPNGDGTTTITLDFPVCHMDPACGDEAAAAVATLMNMGDAAQRADAERDGVLALERMSARVKAALVAWNYAQGTATVDEDRADTDFGAMMDAILVADDVIPNADALPAAPGIYTAVLAFGAAARTATHDADGEAHVMRHLRVVLDAIAARPRLVASGLSLSALQAANIARQAEWCPYQVPDLSFRGNELAGEAGEVSEALILHSAEIGRAVGRTSNVIKKLERERHEWRGSRATKADLADELADVVICADLCAVTAGIDLGAAVIRKFNATSDKVGISVRLSADPALVPSA